MFYKIRDYIVDRYLTWRTGDDKTTRELRAWQDENIDYRAGNIPTMFRKFKHVIEVDWRKFITDDGLAWVPVEPARQYFWPQRQLGDNCVWRIERVCWDQWHKCWFINGIAGEDRIFVATNSDSDAVMIALMYT